MDPADTNEGEIETLLYTLYDMTKEVFLDLDIELLGDEPPKKADLQELTFHNGKIIAVTEKFDNKGTVSLLITVGNNRDEAWYHILELFDKKQDLMETLKSRLDDEDLAPYTIRPRPSGAGIDPVTMTIDERSSAEVVFSITYSIMHKNIIKNSDPQGMRLKALIPAEQNPTLDFSRIIDDGATLLLCHGRLHDRPFWLPAETNILYLDTNPSNYPDILSNIFTDKYEPCHCFDEIYFMGCPIFRLSPKKLTRLLRKISGILSKDGLVYINWYRSLFPESHSLYKDYGSGPQNEGFYEAVLEKYFDFFDYVEFNDRERFLVLKRKKKKI